MRHRVKSLLQRGLSEADELIARNAAQLSSDVEFIVAQAIDRSNNDAALGRCLSQSSKACARHYHLLAHIPKEVALVGLSS
jgi:hypothetical protein